MRSDTELVKAALEGQKKAFASLVSRYEVVVLAVALGVLGNHHSAQDAAQDAFLKAFEKLGTLRKAEVFRPWLLKIAKRCAIDIARRKPKQTNLDCIARRGYVPAKTGKGRCNASLL